MSELWSDLRRVASSSGLYAAGHLLQRGLAFFLLPVYTRFLDQTEYGALELLSSLSGILFVILLLGLPSAVTKCFHRDCEGPDEQASLLSTALLLDLPILVVGGVVLMLFAEPIGRLVVGREGLAVLVRMVVATAVAQSFTSIVMASFRAREKVLAFVALNTIQFVPALGLNVFFVVVKGMGIRGVLLGNLLSSVVAIPIGLWMARRGSVLRWNPKMVRPLLKFGILLVPTALSGWVIGLSDRYVLRIFEDLDQVAVYGVGYKIGMILQMVIVWPFQLAWPAVSFSISKRPGHQESYARTLTYLLVLFAAATLGLALLSRSGLRYLAGEGYEGAHRIVIWVALAYSFSGIQFCVSPGVHIRNKTKYLPLFSATAAAFNVGLNFIVVPRFGIIGAACTTTLTFAALAVATFWLSQRVYPVQYEYGRLIKITVASLLVYALAILGEPSPASWRFAWHAAWATAGMPVALLMMGFLHREESDMIRRLFRRRASN